MYQNIFALDKVPFIDKKDKPQSSSNYYLNNYLYYEKKFEKDFYLNVFLKKALFDVDILELEDFLIYQNENTSKSEKFIKILKLKILPSIKVIITNASISFTGIDKYHQQIKLEGDFIETEGVIKNRNYEFHMFYHKVAVFNLEEDLKERAIIISDYINKIENIEINNNTETLNWCGKPSHLAFIISQLIDEGYIQAPVKKDNEINHSEISRIILKIFSFQKAPSPETLRRYLNNNDDKHLNLKKSFDNAGYHLPHSAILG